MQDQPVPHLPSTWGTSINTVKKMGVPKKHDTLIHYDIKPMKMTFYLEYMLNTYTFILAENHIAIG